MATNAKNGRKMSAKQRQARKRTKLIIFGVEIVVIAVMAVVLWWVWDMFKGPAEGIVITEVPPKYGQSDKVIEETQEGGSMHGYMNIALFGVDAKNKSQLFKSSRSDSIMVANINLDTGDIKLVSVYRDSYLYFKWPIYDDKGNIKEYKETYDKCNGAYSRGGALSAVQMLNMNLDLDIENFITIGYAGLAKIIDGLGGVWIDVDKAEMQHINNYQYSILGKNAKKYNIEITSELNFTPDDYFSNYEVVVVDTPGYQLLNGLQATAYCRIRYVGNDFQRTARQREVIKAIETEAKKADLATLTKIFKDVMNDDQSLSYIYTSFDSATLLELLPNIANYQIVDETGFPQMDMRQSVSMGAKGSCEVPVDLSSSVSWLHEFLYGEKYEPSATVKDITAKINADASKYLKKN